MKRHILVLLTFVLLALALVDSTGAAAPVQVIVNQWALGINEATGCPGDIDGGWQHNSEMSLSRCYKNPSPPSGSDQGGAAFKCGPVNGQCEIGALGESWQDFNAQSRGVAASSTYTVTYSHLQVCVGCTFVKAELLGSADGGQTWDALGTLLDFTPDTAACDTTTFWPTYCGPELVVPHYDLYRLYVTGSYAQQLGYKFTGVQLLMSPAGEAPTPTVTPTPTAVPTATSTPTPTATTAYVPLLLEPGSWQLICEGALTIFDDKAVCEAGN